MGKGFTLVELAIVLVIIGLLTGGVLAGRELIQTAQNSKDIAKFNELNRISMQFMQKYGERPGDYKKSRSMFGTCVGVASSAYTFTHPTYGLRSANACTANCSCNGNGDGLIRAWTEPNTTVTNEPRLFWMDLERGMNIAFSPMYNESMEAYIFNWFGEVSGFMPSPDAYVLVSVPGAYETNVTPFNSTAVRVTSSPTSGTLRRGYLDALNAFAIDTKFDDGLANSGNIRAGNATSQNCFTRTTGVYTSLTSKDCHIYYRID